MAWPFLSIKLTRTYQLTPNAIGGLMSACTIVTIIMGVYGGAKSDRQGRKKLMIFGCHFAIVGNASLWMANSVPVYAIGL
ncbi:MFS transporter, partial [Erwinia amylovora]|uniref:MFS transporter n=1 Tax=Erwinia amylovora TaxID=552 RepID=UPI0037C04FA9|nr:MFS transporter [Erwinia amylovora]